MTDPSSYLYGRKLNIRKVKEVKDFSVNELRIDAAERSKAEGGF